MAIFNYAQEMGLINEGIIPNKVSKDDVLKARDAMKQLINDDKKRERNKKYMCSGRMLFEWIHYNNADESKMLIATIDCPDNYESKVSLKYMINKLSKDMSELGFIIDSKIYSNKDGFIKLKKIVNKRNGTDMTIVEYTKEIHYLDPNNIYNRAIINENNQYKVSEEHIKNAYNSIVHTIKWCRMDSFAFACVKIYNEPQIINEYSFIVGYVDTIIAVNEVLKTLNSNNSFMNGKYNAQINDKMELVITITEIS